MKLIASIALGLVVGIVAGVAWLAASWVWGEYVWPLFTWLFANPDGFRGWDGKSFHLMMLFPAVIGIIAFQLGIGYAKRVAYDRWDRKVDSSAVGWTAATVCILFALAYSGFMFLLAYHAKGLDSFLAFVFGVVFLAGPSWGAISAARERPT